jgi:hypothetical protein
MTFNARMIWTEGGGCQSWLLLLARGMAYTISYRVKLLKRIDGVLSNMCFVFSPGSECPLHLIRRARDSRCFLLELPVPDRPHKSASLEKSITLSLSKIRGIVPVVVSPTREIESCCLCMYGSCENFLQAKFCFLHALPERRPNVLSKSSKRLVPSSSNDVRRERLGDAGTNFSKKTFWKKKTFFGRRVGKRNEWMTLGNNCRNFSPLQDFLHEHGTHFFFVGLRPQLV